MATTTVAIVGLAVVGYAVIGRGLVKAYTLGNVPSFYATTSFTEANE